MVKEKRNNDKERERETTTRNIALGFRSSVQTNLIKTRGRGRTKRGLLERLRRNYVVIVSRRCGCYCRCCCDCIRRWLE